MRLHGSTLKKETPVNLVIFGATGGTGRHLVDQALAIGHRVTALVRTPASLPVTHARLRIVSGDVRDRETVMGVIAGQDAVLSALGPNQHGPVSLCGDAVAVILPAMDSHHVQRLIALSAYGAADSHNHDLYNRMLWLMQKEKMLDKERMEALIRQSDVDWTILRPSALSNGSHTGRYHLGTDVHITLASHISRADLADGMVRQIADATYICQAPAITN